jgi:hypothetical protein
VKRRARHQPKTRAVAMAMAVLLCAGYTTGASAHGPGPGLTGDELQAFETATLGAAHAAEHAAERTFNRRAWRRWHGLSAAQRRRAVLQQRRRDQRAVRASAASSGPPSRVGAWNVDRRLHSLPFPLAPLPVAPTPGDRTYAVHAALLPTGKVIFWGLVPPRYGNESEAYLWDPTKGYGPESFKRVTPPLVDVDGDGRAERTPIYCAGHAYLPDGRLLVTGGNLFSNNRAGYKAPGGIRTAFTFNPWTERWVTQPSMRAGRYYPTETLLGDGRIIVLAGYSETAPGGIDNTDLEIYSARPGSELLRYGYYPTGDRISIPGFSSPPSLYPRMFLMPSGNVFLAGPYKGDSAMLDPKRLRRSGKQQSAWTKTEVPLLNRQGGNAVLMPAGPDGSDTVMQIGGYMNESLTGVKYDQYAAPATNTTEAYDVNSGPHPKWKLHARLKVPRGYSNTVILPDRTLVTMGGGAGGYGKDYLFAVNPDGVSQGKPNAPLHRVELYDPVKRKWRLGPAQAEDRAYHSTALLLPDGRVFSGGDNKHPKPPNGTDAMSDTGEIYSPPYLFKNRGHARPTISKAPAGVRWNRKFAIRTRSRQIAKAVLIAPGAATHGVDMNQRYVPLRVTRVVPGKRLKVLAPPNRNIAPPGYYMLFILNRHDVPSVAKWIRLGAGG